MDIGDNILKILVYSLVAYLVIGMILFGPPSIYKKDNDENNDKEYYEEIQKNFLKYFDEEDEYL